MLGALPLDALSLTHTPRDIGGGQGEEARGVGGTQLGSAVSFTAALSPTPLPFSHVFFKRTTKRLIPETEHKNKVRRGGRSVREKDGIRDCDGVDHE